MAELLNNKWFVLALAIGAGTILYFRVVLPIMGEYGDTELQADVFVGDGLDEMNLMGSETTLDDTTQKIQLVTEQYDLSLIQIGSLRWNTDPKRDPFSSESAMPLNSDSQSKANIDGSEITQMRRLPRVSAIVNAPSLKFAVVDGEILKVGDALGDYLLKTIGPDRVSMRRKSNNNLHILMVEE